VKLVDRRSFHSLLIVCSVVGDIFRVALLLNHLFDARLISTRSLHEKGKMRPPTASAPPVWGRVCLLSLLLRGTSSFSLVSRHGHASERRRTSRSGATSISIPSPTGVNETTAAAVATSQEYDYYLNPLIRSIPGSATVELFSRVKQLESQGVPITSLCVGEPDFLPSPTVLSAMKQALDDGDVKYTAVTGTAALRQAIAHDLQHRRGTTYNPNTEILVSNGAKQAVYQAVLISVGVGDAVLIPAPYWPSYPALAQLAGATPIIVPTSAQSGYKLTPEQLRTTLQEHANIKLLILCHPSNPTGSVYHAGELQELCQVLQEFPQVRVVADEIYERLVYSDEQDSSSICPSVAAQPNMWHRTLTINGFSKAYSMTGLRLGYVAAPAPLCKSMTIVQSQITSCANSIGQAGGVVALQVSEEEMQHNVQVMQTKRDYVLEELARMPHVVVHVKPEGAFYVLPDVSYYCRDFNARAPFENDSDLCLALLEREGVAVVPGSSFGAPGTLRLSYATSMQELKTAMTKMNHFFTTTHAQMSHE
jgi:aspartate/methionine/tyrosine aminotransferase